MTFGAESPRPPCARCSPGNVGPLAEAELRRRAAEYAGALTDGETIDDDVGGVDEKYVAPFRAYLYEALESAGFTIHAALDKQSRRVVVTVRRTPITDARAQTQEAAE